MKQRFLVLFFVLLGVMNASGQVANKKIEAKKVFGGYLYSQHGVRLTVGDMLKIMEPNELAYKEMKAARTNNTIASVIGFAGGFMVGWPLGAAVGGGDPDWTMAAIGAGFICVSIPFSSKFNKQSKNAVSMYNSGLDSSAFWDKLEFNFALSTNKLGVRIQF